jgi:hypothetical protein
LSVAGAADAPSRLGVPLFTRQGPQGKQFFFEKKNQKTFVIKALRLPQHANQFTKVFASFFKKKRFLASHRS